MKQTKKTKPSSKAPEEKTKQLDLGMKEPFKNKLFKLKGKTDKALLQIEVKKFFKDAFFWFVITFTTAMLLQQGYVIYTSYNRIPTLLPILTYNLDTDKTLTDRNYIFIFPAITLFCYIIAMIVTTKFYNREKMLSKFILLCTLLTGVASTILLVYLIQNY